MVLDHIFELSFEFQSLLTLFLGLLEGSLGADGVCAVDMALEKPSPFPLQRLLFLFDSAETLLELGNIRLRLGDRVNIGRRLG